MPMNLEIMIPSDEPVRLLSAVTEELDYRRLTATYSRLGRIEYSPRLLFKIVLYGCSRGIYKTREMERSCRENVNFMYLLEGKPAPDHNTIARFRREHLPYAVEDLLNQMVKLLVNRGEISFEKSAVFIDGTKIEANANRYSFVWKTAVTRRQHKLGEKIANEFAFLVNFFHSLVQKRGLPLMISENHFETAPFSREPLNHEARADSRRFWLTEKYGKRGNTGCISRFSSCTGGAKDPLFSRNRIVQRFLRIPCPK